MSGSLAHARRAGRPPTSPALAILAVLAVACIQLLAPGPWWVLLVASPLLEEVVFRAGLHEAFLRHGTSTTVANVLVAASFALVHVMLRDDWMAAGVFIPAVMIGLAYTRWRRVRICVALHAAMNGAWLVGASMVWPSIGLA